MCVRRNVHRKWNNKIIFVATRKCIAIYRKHLCKLCHTPFQTRTGRWREAERESNRILFPLSHWTGLLKRKLYRNSHLIRILLQFILGFLVAEMVVGVVEHTHNKRALCSLAVSVHSDSIERATENAYFSMIDTQTHTADTNSTPSCIRIASHTRARFHIRYTITMQKKHVLVGVVHCTAWQIKPEKDTRHFVIELIYRINIFIECTSVVCCACVKIDILCTRKTNF